MSGQIMIVHSDESFDSYEKLSRKGTSFHSNSPLRKPFVKASSRSIEKYDIVAKTDERLEID